MEVYIYCLLHQLHNQSQSQIKKTSSGKNREKLKQSNMK